MLKDLPVHTRQSLYRCLNVVREPWIEQEPELTWAKYTCLDIRVNEQSLMCYVNGYEHSLFDMPCAVWNDGSIVWRRHGNAHRQSGGPDGILLYPETRQVLVRRSWNRNVGVSIRGDIFIVLENDAVVHCNAINDVVKEIGGRISMNPYDRGVLTHLLQKLFNLSR